MIDKGRKVHFVADSVAAKLLVYEVTMCVSIFFDSLTDLVEFGARLANLDSSEHCLTSNLAQSLDIWVNITNQHHSRIVSVASILVANDIDIDVVTVFKFVVRGDTVRHDIIDRSAHALWEMVEVNC